MKALPMVWLVFFAALLTAIATGLGAMPFFFRRTLSPVWLGISSAMASGIMLAASFGLLNASINNHPLGSLIGVVIGMAFVALVDRGLARFEGLLPVHSPEALNHLDFRRMLLILVVMTAHSVAEGIGIGVAFGDARVQLGWILTLAIALHNVPEGLAISLVLVPRGVSPWKAAVWSVFSSLPQPILAVPAFLFTLAFRSFLPVGMGLAAGAMIWMIFAELLTEAFAELEKSKVGIIVVLAFAVMLFVQYMVLPLGV